MSKKREIIQKNADTKMTLKEMKETFPCAFLSSEELKKTWFFRLSTLVLKYTVLLFYNFKVVGINKLPKDKAYIILSHHSFHNHDVFPSMVAMFQDSGIVIRGLMDRTLTKYLPHLGLLGCVPGQRDVAVALLKEGIWIAVIPGGGEEAVRGHEQAYNLWWKSKSGRPRHGWAHVAKEANVEVVPLAGINTQEMFFNIFAFLFNILYLSKLYDLLLDLPYGLGDFFHSLKAWVWWIVCTFFSIPIPVQAGVRMGKPIKMNEGESIEDFAKRTEKILQDFINETNPGGLSYSRALRMRFNGMKEEYKKWE